MAETFSVLLPDLGRRLDMHCIQSVKTEHVEATCWMQGRGRRKLQTFFRRDGKSASGRCVFT